MLAVRNIPKSGRTADDVLACVHRSVADIVQPAKLGDGDRLGVDELLSAAMEFSLISDSVPPVCKLQDER
jgi:hypothetical protein